MTRAYIGNIYEGHPETCSRTGQAVSRRIAKGSHVTVIIDRSVAGAETMVDLLAAMSRAGLVTETVECTRPPTTADVQLVTDQINQNPGTWVIGIGGGSAMDTAALAALWASEPAAANWCLRPQRSGLVSLPEHVRRTHPLMLVPTTIGTGAENSQSACFVHSDGRRLLVHHSLRPDVAVHDPALLASIPRTLMQEACLEIFYRLAVLHLGASQGTRISGGNPDVFNAVRKLIGLAQMPDTSNTHVELARVSSQSHAPEMMAAVDRFAGKVWYVATETSDVLHTRKVPAIAALLPSMFALISAGRTGWGDSSRLQQFWGTVRDESTALLPAGPAQGVHALISRWGIQAATPDHENVELIVQRSIRRWGGGLPMLGGLRSQDIHELVTGAALYSAGDYRGTPASEEPSPGTFSARSAKKRSISEGGGNGKEIT